MRIYTKSILGVAVDTRRTAIVAASLLTDGVLTAIKGQSCRFGCGSRFHTTAAHTRHEYVDHQGDPQP